MFKNAIIAASQRRRVWTMDKSEAETEVIHWRIIRSFTVFSCSCNGSIPNQYGIVKGVCMGNTIA